MATTKIAITIPEFVLQMVDKLAKKYNKARSTVITEILDTNIKVLLEDEVAESYNAAFKYSSVKKEQKEWSEKLLILAENVQKYGNKKR